MPSASTAACSRASISRTASATGRADATATASSSCCPTRTCCWCCRRKVSWRWSGRPPTSTRSSRGSRRSRARPGTTPCWPATSCWSATARRWPHSGCPSRATEAPLDGAALFARPQSLLGPLAVVVGRDRAGGFAVGVARGTRERVFAGDLDQQRGAVVAGADLLRRAQHHDQGLLREVPALDGGREGPAVIVVGADLLGCLEVGATDPGVAERALFRDLRQQRGEVVVRV